MRYSPAILLLSVWVSASVCAQEGVWPEPRHDGHLTAYQPTPGAMKTAPSVLAKTEIQHATASPTYATVDGAPAGLCVVAGALECYTKDGRRWACHPPGLNIDQIQRLEDLDGDGKVEVLATAGRPAQPFGAAVLVDVATGDLRWRYDVEPMSYSWTLHVGAFLPGLGNQIVVLMQGYPPDKQNGYVVLFDFPEKGATPRQRWRYAFPDYTCYPNLLSSDVDGDGMKELAVVTHSRMWVMDPAAGDVKQFIKWDVSPANVRSYGLNRFVDLDADGHEDFLCIANFSQHHEVLLSRGGKLEEAWHYGWHESVTTGKVATTWPEPPVADIDGDKAREVVVSMYNAEDKPEWIVRVYDAVSGKIKHTYPGVIATALLDVDGDGVADILGNACTDPTKNVFQGARVLAARSGALTPIWSDDHFSAPTWPDKAAPTATVTSKDGSFAVAKQGDAFVTNPVPVTPAPPAPPSLPMPNVLSGTPTTLIAERVSGRQAADLILHANGTAHVYALDGGGLSLKRRVPSECPPACGDFDGDGRVDLAICRIAVDASPTVEVLSHGEPDKTLWTRQLPPSGRPGLPQPRKAYLRTARFTGKATPDLYLWAGSPIVQSVGLDGRTGEVLWEKGEIPNSERYWGPSVNHASAYDANGDGKEDLVFTNPDYLCVADGSNGDLLLGPLFPPDIFKQPSQGLYTYPAILTRVDGPPWVALVDGHYFQGVLTVTGTPAWYDIPAIGQNRCAAEAFLPLDKNTWLMGFGRQNGAFACVNVADGSVRWDLPVEATCSDAIAADVDGDGRPEFVFGTSHGALYAVGDDNGMPRVVWKVGLGAAVLNPILADLDGDGTSEIACMTGSGEIVVLDGTPAK